MPECELMPSDSEIPVRAYEIKFPAIADTVREIANLHRNSLATYMVILS